LRGKRQENRVHVTLPAQREGIRWYPRVRIEKYSPDQTAWARQRAGCLSGDLLRILFPVPECGVITDEGNGVSAAGLANLACVLTGTGGHPLAPGRASFGVGADGGTEFDPKHGSLAPGIGESPGTTLYKAMDARYPVVARPSLIMGQATFTETEACFPWHEWCWASGPREPRPHHQLHSAYHGEGAVMVNRKAQPAGYGVKELGVAWCFRTQIELS
jgi:hypothetical protein